MLKERRAGALVGAVRGIFILGTCYGSSFFIFEKKKKKKPIRKKKKKKNIAKKKKKKNIAPKKKKKNARSHFSMVPFSDGWCHAQVQDLGKK